MDKLYHWVVRILRWSEKYTKTDMVYLAGGGLWLTIAQGIGSLSALILTIAFANLLPPELYGNYRYILSIIGIITVAAFPGLTTAAITGVAKGEESAFWRLVRTKALWSLASTVTAGAVALYYAWQGNMLLAVAFVIAAIALPLIHTSGMYTALLNGRKNFRRLAQATSATRVTTTIAILIALFFTDNVLVFITLYFVPDIIMQSLFLFQLYRTRPTETHGTSSNTLSHFGFHLSVMEVLKTIAAHIDKVLVFHFLGAAPLALYFIATTAPGQIKSILQNTTTLALPKFSNASPEDIAETLPQKLLRLEVVVLVAVVLYWILAPLVFPIIFPQYVEAIFISQVYALSLLFFPRTFFSTALTAHHKKKELYAIRIGAPITRIVIFLVALPLFGLWGAVLGSILANALTALIYHFFFKRAFPSGRRV